MRRGIFETLIVTVAFDKYVEEEWSLAGFNLRKHMISFRDQLRRLAGALQSLWSLRGAVGLAAIILVINAVQLLVAIRGKLVILPFEIHTDQMVSPDFGASFAQSLAARLNDYRRLFPPINAQDRPTVDKTDNSFDIIESFLADLPLVNIPRLTPLNKGSITLDSLKIGPVSLPIDQLIFKNLAFFHTDTLRGTIESFGNQITVRFSFGSDETIISIAKDQGYRNLIDRIAVELLERKKWISPIPMNPAALHQFADGLQSY